MGTALNFTDDGTYLGEYDPPILASDERVCRRCAEGFEDAIWFPLLNSRTGKYHTSGHWDDLRTYCGQDATQLHFVWPL